LTHAFDDPRLLTNLQTIALRQHDRFIFRPRLPLFLPGEALEFRYVPVPAANTGANKAANTGASPPPDSPPNSPPGDTLQVTFRAGEGPSSRTLTLSADSSKPLVLPQDAALGKGLHTVDATLLRNGAPVWTDHSAFWMRDWAYLRSGPKLTVGNDYFELDGKPLPVVGTTYMASDVDRLFLEHPNAFLWDRDMAQIRASGLNMIRSGIWSGWRFVTRPDGSMSEDALRTIEAFLMTARHNGLPVQFNLFAFVPNIFGGENAYLDPVALRAQDRYVRSIAGRFHDVPFLAWDLINEPSANSNV
jgi:hypothetical protein